MKRILIIYPYYVQQNLVHNLSSKLQESDLAVDYFCFANLKCSESFIKNSPLWMKPLLNYLAVSKENLFYRIVRRFLLAFFHNGRINSIIRKYDIVDFHAYIVRYNNLMKSCVTLNVPFDITLWGSDIMRVSESDLKEQKYGYENCRYIKCYDNMREVLTEKVGDIYNDKIRIVYFGNSNFPIIDSLSNNTIAEIKEQLYGSESEKLIVVCGYNAIRFQNHIQIIKSLEEIGNCIQNKIHIVLPLTYGADKSYVAEIETSIKKTGISYTILNRYLSQTELAEMRISADIVVNIQETDGFASSLQEHLYCGNVCVIGEWLNYIPYDKNDVFYIKTSKQELSRKLLEVIDSYNQYHNKCKSNHDILKKILSWDKIIKNWVGIYNE